MKRHVISTVVVLAILVVAWSTFGQEEEGTAERRQPERQGFQNISREGRRVKFIESFFKSGGFISREEQQKSIKAIEEQCANLKAAQLPQIEGSFQDFSDEKRSELWKMMRKYTKVQMQAIRVITDQVAKIQGLHLRDGEDARYFIMSSNQLKRIQDMAIKEKAKKTSELLERMITRGVGRGFGGRRPAGNRPQGGKGSRRSAGEK